MKIGLPAPDSIQAIVLRRAAQKELGNPTALDSNMQAIAHPLGMQSLLKGQITGHLTTPPFQFQEVEKGGQVILKSADIFGKSSAASVFMKRDFYDQYPDFGKALYVAINEATELLNEKPDEAAKLLSQVDGGKVSPEQYKNWITNEAVEYSVVPKGFLKYAKFMREIGMLNKQPETIEELTLPTLLGTGGD
jgi:NitT/TauT family transport system substrate-binding protein